MENGHFKKLATWIKEHFYAYKIGRNIIKTTKVLTELQKINPQAFDKIADQMKTGYNVSSEVTNKKAFHNLKNPLIIQVSSFDKENAN